MDQPKTPQEVEEVHQLSDVDSSTVAQHHTLGFSPTQAAPGNHKHDGSGSPSLAGYSVVGHGHAEGDVTSLINDLSGKAASIHTHAESDTTNLVSDLAGKAPTSHTHTEANVTNLVTDLAGKAASVHTHAESDTTNLVADLAGKAATSHTHTEANVTNLVADLASKFPFLTGTAAPSAAAATGSIYTRTGAGAVAGARIYIYDAGWVATSA